MNASKLSGNWLGRGKLMPTRDRCQPLFGKISPSTHDIAQMSRMPVQDHTGRGHEDCDYWPRLTSLGFKQTWGLRVGDDDEMTSADQAAAQERPEAISFRVQQHWQT
jgi:hypothetical protein